MLLDPTAQLFVKALFMTIDTDDLAQIWYFISKGDREIAVSSLT